MRITMKDLFRIYYLCLVISVLIGILYHYSCHPEAHFVWDKLPAFHALFGFIGCVILIVVSKAIGHHWLMKEEDYYEKH
ncbi:MAG: hypothetical protein ACXQTW_05455 [Candidatus Methanospirareceae archaeon]